LDQSGELGGAELCLADIAEFAEERSAVLLFQDGPFSELLRARDITVHLAALQKMAARVDKGTPGSTPSLARKDTSRNFSWFIRRHSAHSNL
jgi:hypothetical protein